MFEDGSVYTGDWKNSKRHGRGSQTYTRDRPEKQVHAGDSYDGGWTADAKDGMGEYMFGANKRIYGAGFVNNEPRDPTLFKTTMDLKLPHNATRSNLEALFAEWGSVAAGVALESCKEMQLLVQAAIKVGDRSLLVMLSRDFHVNMMRIRWEDGSSAMDRALEAGHAEVVGLLVEWNIANATTPPRDMLQGILTLWVASSESTSAKNVLAYVKPRLLMLDEEGVHFVPIASRAAGSLLKQLWEDLNAGLSVPDRNVWGVLYALSCTYFDSCIKLARPRTDLLCATYRSTRDQHKGMYTSTMDTVKHEPNFARYSSIVAGIASRVAARYADAEAPATQGSNELRHVYCDALAIEARYQRFMTMLSRKTSRSEHYTAVARKNPFRAMEKVGLALAPEQWLASRVKDILRGAQVMADVAEGLQLLELMVACDQSEAADSTQRGWNAKAAGITEEICIVDVKNRWETATSGGWSDVLITFHFADDPAKHVCEVQLVHSDMMMVRKQMEAHAGYTTFRCALELLEATGHADIVTAIDAEKSASELQMRLAGARSTAVATPAASASAAEVAEMRDRIARLEDDLDLLKRAVIIGGGALSLVCGLWLRSKVA